jgi:hypothetical protein
MVAWVFAFPPYAFWRLTVERPQLVPSQNLSINGSEGFGPKRALSLSVSFAF